MKEETTIYTGEKCSVCKQLATHKIGEEFAADDPRAAGHNLTNYVCDEHFNMVICPYKYKPKDLEEAAQVEVDKMPDTESVKTYQAVRDAFKAGANWQLTNIYTTGYTAGVQAELKSVEKLRETVKLMILHSSSSNVGLPNDYEHGKHTAANFILEEINELWPQNNSV